MRQPQEIEVWYVLPAIRRELAKIMTKKHNLSQKETAKILDVSEPAISQYMKSKRAKEVKFTKGTKKFIEESAERIINNNKMMIEEMQKLCHEVKKDLTLCKLHRQKDPHLSSKCRICLGESK